MENITKEIKVAITYSHDSEEHIASVERFCATLRSEWGFNAELDSFKRQESTSINFTKMQHDLFTSYDKVVVVLSEGYKKKAEKFSGGVGDEYLMLINDIKQNINKYVIVLLNDSNKEYKIPLALKGNDYVNLSNKEDWDILNSKLQGVALKRFPKVREGLIPINSQEIGIFENEICFEIFGLIGRGCKIAGRFTTLSLSLKLKVVNKSTNYLDKILIQFKELEDFFERIDGSTNIETKQEIALFQNQEEVIKLPTLVVHLGNCYKFINSDFKVFLFSSLGKQELILDFKNIPMVDDFEDKYLRITDFNI